MFQSTPPRRGRLHRNADHVVHAYCFNPRPRVGGDATRLHFSLPLLANTGDTPPTRPVPKALGQTIIGFNPRPRVGGDPRKARTQLRARRSFTPFQSTPPRRGRLDFTSNSRQRSAQLPMRFNPRPRVGGDDPQHWTAPKDTGFNPRPRVGGDTRTLVYYTRRLGFQSTPPRRGRPSA